jgi:hypothetical protein
VIEHAYTILLAVLVPGAIAVILYQLHSGSRRE